MSKIEPIRDKKDIKAMKNELMKQRYRDYMLFVFGINTGLRISDIVPLQVRDVRDCTHINLVEKKTGKERRIPLNFDLIRELENYYGDMTGNDYLFPSQKGGHISRKQGYRVIRQAAEKVGLENIATHSMRKTFGYHHYKEHKDIAILQKIFNHSTPSITLEYIGINQDIIDESLKDFSL